MSNRLVKQIPILLLFLAGCHGEVIQKRVVSIGDCTNAASDAWGGYNPGSCRVTLDDGSKATMLRPVDIGDVYIGYKFVEDSK